MRRRAIAATAALALVLAATAPAYAATYFADPNPPSVASASVDKARVSVGDTLTVSYDVEDADGVSSVSVSYGDEDPSVEPDNDDVHSTTWTASTADTSRSRTFGVTSRDAAGRRWVYSLTVTDKAGWVTTIYDATYAKTRGIDGPTADLSALTWEVLEHGDDPNPPSVASASVDKARVSVGDTLTVSYDVEDADGVSSVSVSYGDEDPSVEPDNDDVHSTTWTASTADTSRSRTFGVTSRDAAGRRWVYSLTVTDKAGWVTTIYDATYAKTRGIDGPTADLSALTWEIVAPSEIPPYSVLDGEAAKYEKGAESGVSFRFSGAADELFSVQVDGTTISSDSYTVASGSTIVTLKPSYLDTLAEGDHTVTAYYKDGGRATASFNVAAKEQKKDDETKDDSKKDETDDGSKKDETKNDETDDGSEDNKANDQSKDNEAANAAAQGNAKQDAPATAKAPVKKSTPETGDQSAPAVAVAAAALALLAAAFTRFRVKE